MEQVVVVFLIVVALFVAASLIKTVLGLAFRYALFVAAAVLVYQDRYGTEVLSWITTRIATEIALVAGVAFVATSVFAAFFFCRSQFRFVIVPAFGLVATLLAARFVAG